MPASRPLKQLGDTDDTKEKAAVPLRNLAVNADSRVAIAVAGGIAPLAELTRSGTAVAKEQAAGLLANLASDNAALRWAASRRSSS